MYDFFVVRFPFYVFHFAFCILVSGVLFSFSPHDLNSGAIPAGTYRIAMSPVPTANQLTCPSLLPAPLQYFVFRVGEVPSSFLEVERLASSHGTNQLPKIFSVIKKFQVGWSYLSQDHTNGAGVGDKKLRTLQAAPQPDPQWSYRTLSIAYSSLATALIDMLEFGSLSALSLVNRHFNQILAPAVRDLFLSIKADTKSGKRHFMKMIIDLGSIHGRFEQPYASIQVCGGAAHRLPPWSLRY